MNDYSDSFIYLIPTAVSSPLHAQVQLVVRTGSDNDFKALQVCALLFWFKA